MSKVSFLEIIFHSNIKLVRNSILTLTYRSRRESSKMKEISSEIETLEESKNKSRLQSQSLERTLHSEGERRSEKRKTSEALN